MDSVYKKVIEFFVSNDIMKDEDRELYEYALKITVSAMIHILTIVALGIIFSLLVESIIFYICFIAIRKFAGGYHAQTAGKCYFYSLLLSVLLLVVLKLLTYNFNIVTIAIVSAIGLISVVIIWIMAPLDTENNPLSDKEKSIYKKITRVIVMVVFAAYVALALFGYYNIALSVGFGIFMSALVLTMRKTQILFSKEK